MQIKMINLCKILQKVLSHTIKSVLINERIVRYKAYNPISILQAIYRPSKKSYICIPKCISVSSTRVFSISLLYTFVDHLILTIFVIIVLTYLSSIIRWIANHHHNLSSFFFLYSFRIFLHKQGQLSSFCQFQRIHEADALEGFIVAHFGVVFVLDVQGRDVVREQHNLVTEEVVLVLVLQLVARDAMQQVDDKAAGARRRIEDLHAGLGDRRAELALQYLLHAGAHEIDDLLRRVDDAEGVGALDRVALEEALVDRVQEVLALRPALYALRGGLDGDVEAVERLEELVAVEGAAGERLDDALDLGGDDIAAHEVGVVEDGAEEALGQQVLDEHFVDYVGRDPGIERGAAELGKGVEGGDKAAVSLVLALDNREQRFGELGDARLELLHSRFEVLDIRFGVGEELLEQVADIVRVLQIVLDGYAPLILVEHGPARILEDGVAERIASSDLLRDLPIQVALRPLRLPVAASKRKVAAQHAIGPDVVLDRLLRYKRPFHGARGIRQQVLKGRSHGQLVVRLALVFVELSIVALNGLLEQRRTECGRALHVLLPCQLPALSTLPPGTLGCNSRGAIIYLSDQPANTFNDISIRGIAIGPHCNSFCVLRQSLQRAEGSGLPIAGAQDNGNHRRLACYMSLHRHLHLNAVAIVRGDKGGADEQQDNARGL